MGSGKGGARRKVFFVLDSLAQDGVGHHVATLLGRLSRARFEPRVVTLRGEGPLGSALREMAVTVHALPGGNKLDLFSVPRLRKLLTTMEADLVHVFHPMSAVVSALAVPKGVPVVRYVPRLAADHDPLATRLWGSVERLTARRRRVHFVAGSEGARAIVSNRFGGSDVSVVPECLDLVAQREQADAVDASDARVRLGVAPDDRVVVCFTGFHDKPFGEAVLGGLSMALVERPGIRLFLVGTGPAESFARWHAEELRLGDAVIFIRDESGMDDLLSVADVVVDAAQWPGPSRCGLRAAAVGRPVLRWVDGRDAGDFDATPPSIASVPELFAGELMRVLDDDDLREALRAKSEEPVARSAVPLVAEQWAELYDDVVATTVRES